MAKGSIIKGNDAIGREKAQTRNSEVKLSQKLQADLENTLLRLFESSLYCDLELIVESDSVLAHSCILQARVARFYRFLINECQVLKKNGLSSVVVCNVSFSRLKKFVENIYKNVQISEVEDCMLQYLLRDKKDTGENNKNSLSVESSPKSTVITASPEGDLFYTPRCSPSEVQKSIVETPDLQITKKENDITCYYKIVSVDDFQFDEKADLNPEKSRDDICFEEGEHLEKELAEQDELLLSFKSIFSKVNKPKSGSHTIQYKGYSRAKIKEGPNNNRKFQSNSLLSDEYKKPKVKLPLWKPNPATRADAVETRIDKHNSVKSTLRNSFLDPWYLRKKLEIQTGVVVRRTKNSSNSSEMDISAAGADSGLETSSSLHPEVSPRENTVSETSGVDLTEAAINEEIPHDEENISAKQAKSVETSSSSDCGTWDVNDEKNFNQKKVKTSFIKSDDCKGIQEYEEVYCNGKKENFVCPDKLDEEEMARLDAMEKNIKECEKFLDRERQIFYYFDSSPLFELVKKSSKSDISDVSSSKSVQDIVFENKIIFSENSAHTEAEDSNITNRNNINEENILCCEELRNYSKKVPDTLVEFENIDSDDNLSDKIMCKNLINNAFKNNNCTEQINCNDTSEIFKDNHCDPLLQQDFDRYYENSKDTIPVKTPPCSPRQISKSSFETEDEKKENLVLCDVKCSYQNANSIVPVVSNYFIDASSLLDEDEIISPPVSLINFKSADGETGAKIVNNVDEEVRGGDCEKLAIQEEEKRQGELIFKHSIPHFSRHEISQVNEAMERLRESGDRALDNSCSEAYDDNEQVVPSADIQMNFTNQTNFPHSPSSEFTHPEAVTFRSLQELPTNFMLAGEEAVGDEGSLRDAKGEDFDDGKRLTNVESLPIVSGGARPEDFSNSPSRVSSPHLRRRNESAPILSGGMECAETDKKSLRKPSANQGTSWTVSFSDEKPHKKHSGTRTSESDAESSELSSDLMEGGRPSEAGATCKDVGYRDTRGVLNSCNVNKAKELNNEEKLNQRTSNQIEKSASLGYFIEFSKEEESTSNGEDKKEKTTAPESMKKNMFSMFIDMNDDSRMTETVPSFPRSSMMQENSDVDEEGAKKPFYMFIESDLSATGRKTNAQHFQRKPPKGCDAEREGVAGQSKNSEARKENSTSLSAPSGSSSSLGSDTRNVQQTRHSKLPLPLCKSSSLTAVSRDAQMVVWSEKKDRQDNNNVSGETWLRTNGVQVTYKGKKEGSRESQHDGNELRTVKKGSTFVVSDEPGPGARRRDSKSGFHLRALEETQSSCKSPEERDSGVIVTEESDDSFVKLSDMDNYKNPYLETNRSDANPNRMSQSIPEGKWKESTAFTKTGEDENSMSKSAGTSVIKSNSGTSFASDRDVSRSLSRLFPNLNFSNGLPRKSSSSIIPAGKHDTDQSDTQISELSEMSSMQSSIEPSTLEISTSETDVSCHNGTSRLGEDLLRMFLEEISPDVIVEVGGRRMKAHKCILSSRCQYFAAMLSGGWVESAGNVISLQGFSYNSVHFALCHIYSGENRIPDSLNIIELATLADILCLEGLKEVISHTLKVKYCHCFHLPCEECHVGVLDCLPIAAAYGLDDLYRKCLRWISKHFVKVWPTKAFANLPKELLDKCYQHHIVHMTVDNILDTIISIDKIRGSLPSVRWSETVSRLVGKLNDAAVKYIADHFSSILTSDSFLALGKEESWSIGRLEDTLMEATKRLPPEQACWSHARLHKILFVAKGPDPPIEMIWNENFIDLLQCIAVHVENSLIKQAPRAAKSKAWRQMEPELRNRIQERACLVLPDDARSPKMKPNNLKRESRAIGMTSTAKSNIRNLEIKHMKLTMTQQGNRTASLSRVQNTDQRALVKDQRYSRSVGLGASVKKLDNVVGAAKKTNVGAPEMKKVTPSKYMDVKPRYLDPKSPQKISIEKPNQISNVRRATKPLSSSDSSRNCSPLNANVHGRAGIVKSNRQHRESVASSESGVSQSVKKDKSSTPSVKTLSRLTADDNMSTDSLFTDSLHSENDATTKKADDTRSKGKENVRKAPSKFASSNGSATKSSSYSPSTRRGNTDSPGSSSFKSYTTRKPIATSASGPKTTPPKRFSPGSRKTNVNQREGFTKSNLSSTRVSTNRNAAQIFPTKYDANLINGNSVKKKKDMDTENNRNSAPDDMRPKGVSRSGTFLKDEPTILKKPQADNIENSF